MIPKLDLPADVRLDTLAVREGLPRTQYGENSEALFLTSSFVHPDAASAARRFANEEAVSYTHLDVYKRQELGRAWAPLCGHVLSGPARRQPCLLYTSRCV